MNCTRLVSSTLTFVDGIHECLDSSVLGIHPENTSCGRTFRKEPNKDFLESKHTNTQ